MELWNAVYDQLLNTSLLEFVAVVCGILSVWYGKKESILVYPFGMVSVCIFIYLTWVYGLYAETGINMYYFIMSIYGWYNWRQPSDKGVSQLKISRTDGKGRMVSLIIFLMSFGVIYLLLSQFTNSTVPVLDALTTGLAITGMYLMALKRVEHWLFWIACDLISVPLYAYKGLPFTSLQFLVFTYLAILGWISWSKKLKQQHISKG